MTYEEAKMQIQAIPEKIWDQLSEPDREAMEMAFSALQAQDSPKPIAESVQNVQNEDLISRKAAIDAECEVCQIAPKKERGHNCTYYVHGCKEIECLRALPPAQPEPCEDAVSRADVVDMLEMFPFTEYSEYETAREVVKRLPSVQPKPHWIPVSEKLPEVAHSVLFSRRSMDTREGCLQADDKWWQYRWNEILNANQVTAWMPLPEPYRAERRTDERSD